MEAVELQGDNEQILVQKRNVEKNLDLAHK